MKTDLLVIIVTYNAMKWVDRCFDSLIDSTYPNDVFVVDNGSTDGTQDYIKSKYPNVIFVQSGENLGFGKANNLGFKYAIERGYEYVYLLNQDAWVEKNTFISLVEVSKEYSDYGILSPLQMNANLDNFDSSFYSLLTSDEGNKKYLIDLALHRKVEKIYPVKQVMAAHWLITKKCLIEVGGFSPSFPHYGEDNNYIQRADFWGFRTGYVPSCYAVHDREYRPTPLSKTIYFYYISYIINRSNVLVDKSLNPYGFVSVILKACIKYRKLYPLKYIYRILKEDKTILSNKKDSITKKGAFLN